MHTRLLLLLGLALTLCRPAVALSMTDVQGTRCTIPNTQAKATVLLFIAHDCPIANGYAPEIQRMAARYGARGITFELVYVESDLTVAGAKQHAAAYGYHLPALRDRAHILVRRYGVTVTPEAVVLSPTDKREYEGRIDDKYVGLGRSRFTATRHDLRAALDAVLLGHHAPRSRTQAVGCPIPSD